MSFHHSKYNKALVKQVIYFLLWTLFLYAIHRLAHSVPSMYHIHKNHHMYIQEHKTSWKWNNLLLYNDNKLSTIDLWLTEVLPTIVFSIITQQYWIMAIYYIWAAFFQEILEHSNINLYPLTFGKWHMMHHRYTNCNYGLLIPVWDKLFRTEKF